MLVFSKQLPSGRANDGSLSLRAAHCERALVSPLSRADTDRVSARIHADPDLRTVFEAYAPEPTDLIVNLSMRAPDRTRLESVFDEHVKPAMQRGVTLDCVLETLADARLAKHVGQMPTNATLQLVNHRHELRDGDFVLRDARILPF